MTRMFAGSTCLTVALAFGIGAFAQTPSQTPQPQPPTSSKPTQATDQTTAMDPVTIVGCVQSEADYRKAHNLGRGGAVGTGVGVGNEYVLVNASRSMAGSTPPTGAAAGTATGTTGSTSSAGEAYELTGTSETQVGQYVGKRVEIVGRLKPAATGATGPTGGATAGTPPSGVDVASKDLKLRELEVTSVREITGICPAAKG
jgi:hypothetical protein